MTWFIGHLIFISFDGLIDSEQPADVAVILGNTVYSDSTLSPRLQARLEKGVEVYHSGQVKMIIVSGGTGVEGVNEATEMYKFLVGHQVPERAILVDTVGNNTRLTAKHTTALLGQNNLKSVLIVSQFYHLSRCRLLFKQQDISVVGTLSPNYFEWRDTYSLFREFFGFYFYLVL